VLFLGCFGLYRFVSGVEKNISRTRD